MAMSGETRKKLLKKKMSVGGQTPYGWYAEARNLVPHYGERKIVNVAEHLRSKKMRLREIAEVLNARGFRTRSGGEFVAKHVPRLLEAHAKINQRKFVTSDSGPR